MFTGIITNIGKIKEIIEKDNEIEVKIATDLKTEDIYLGQSISCDGVCLSITKIEGSIISFYISKETLAKTILKDWYIDYEVNIELAMQINSRFDGHIVSGHIDNIAEITNLQKIGSSYMLTLTLPAQYLKYIIEKGSICLNGVSLTVNNILANNIEINIIPITWHKTNFKNLKIGSEINFEVDMLAKYLEKLK
jgi:riboflavin synthase